jgi:hypothetical protein
MASDPSHIPVTRVTITGHDPAFPGTCCCCGQPADRMVTLSATKNIPLVVATLRRRMTVPVPCCAVCGPRVAWENDGGLLGLVPKGIGCLVGSALMGCVMSLPAALLLAVLVEVVSLPPEVRRPLARSLPWVLTAAVFAGWLAWELRKRPRGDLGPAHVCMRGALYIKRFDAQGLTLNFLRKEAALAFAGANPGRVVSVEATTLGREVGRLGR